MTMTEPPEKPDLDVDGEIEEEPDATRPPPPEWVDPEFPEDTDDIDDDTHDDVPEVDAT